MSTSDSDILVVLNEVATYVRDRNVDDARRRVDAADRSGLRDQYVAQLGTIAEVNRGLAEAKRQREAIIAQIASVPERDRLHVEHVFRELLDTQFDDLIVSLRLRKRVLSRKP